MTTRATVLYVSYDGMLEPLGQSQVIAYLERLAANYEFHLLSFEKAADWNNVATRDTVAALLRKAGIHCRSRCLRAEPRIGVATRKSRIPTPGFVAPRSVFILGRSPRHRR